MGLPEILIEFKSRAETAVQRSENGIVAMILKDDTKTGDDYTSYAYSQQTDIDTTHWSVTNQKYLSSVFKNAPNLVLVERIATSGNYDDALSRLKNKNWNYLAIPGLQKAEVEDIGEWIIA